MRILLLTLIICLNICKLSAQSIPFYLPPDKLVTYVPLESDEIENSIDKTYPDNTYKSYKRNGNKTAVDDELIKFQLKRYLNVNESFDRLAKPRKGLFLSDLTLSSSKINYRKPITIGFWSSNRFGRSQKIDYILKDSLKLSVDVNSDFASVRVSQCVNNLYQSDTFYVEKYSKEPLYSVGKNEGWYLLIIELDVNTIRISINGEQLQTFNLSFLKKRDLKKKIGKYTWEGLLTNPYQGGYGETKIAGSNIDDLFVYEKLLSNDEIAALINSDLSPYYFKEIRDSIKSINTNYFNALNSKDLSQRVKFMNKDLSSFKTYINKFNELSTYPKLIARKPNSFAKTVLDSLRLTHSDLEKSVGNNIDYLLDSLLINNSKASILNSYDTYISSGIGSISYSYQKRYADKFKKAVANFFYQSLDTNTLNVQSQQKLISDIKLDFKKIVGEEFDIDNIFNTNPPKSGVIKFYSSSKDYLNNPKYDYNDDPSVYMTNSVRTIKWDQKELSFINSKLEGVQKFYDTGKLVYEYELKEGKLTYEKWYDYSDSAISPKILDKFYDSKVYYERGKQKLKNQHYSKATLDFTNAIMLSSNNADYYFLRGSSFVSLNSTVNFENDFLTSAKDDFDKAVELNKSNAGFYYARGMVKFQLKDLDGSYQDLKQALDMGYIDNSNMLAKINTLIKEKKLKEEAADRVKQIQYEKNEAVARAKQIQAKKQIAKSQNNPGYNGEYFTDQSGNSYKTVKIGNRVWMAENLKTTRYVNGDEIKFETKVSWYIGEPILVALYSGQFLYSWEAINDNRGIAPKGWHVPTPSEWEELISYCRNNADLKSTSGWPVAEYGGYYSIISCPNCKNWNSEYKRKVACNVCKDTRKIRGPYVKKTSEIRNGNNRLGFNVKNLGVYHKGEFDRDNIFWTSVLNTENCGSVCGNVFMFDLHILRVTYNLHHEYLLPIRLVKD